MTNPGKMHWARMFNSGVNTARAELANLQQATAALAEQMSKTPQMRDLIHRYLAEPAVFEQQSSGGNILAFRAEFSEGPSPLRQSISQLVADQAAVAWAPGTAGNAESVSSTTGSTTGDDIEYRTGTWDDDTAGKLIWEPPPPGPLPGGQVWEFPWDADYRPTKVKGVLEIAEDMAAATGQSVADCVAAIQQVMQGIRAEEANRIQEQLIEAAEKEPPEPMEPPDWATAFERMDI